MLFLICADLAWGQKQLLLLKGEKVLLRLYPGDEFVYRLKGSKVIRTTYVNNLSDTAVVTHRDTVPFRRIDRIYFEQRTFRNLLGSAFVTFGAGIFLIDQINTVLVHGEDPSLDNRVSAGSLASLAVGLPLILIKKKSQKLKYRYRLLVVGKGSVFYVPDIRKNRLPWLEN
ncbi:MAG TPA: hypothetical protein VF490_13065 [Chryseosolibacter sp.]